MKYTKTITASLLLLGMSVLTYTALANPDNTVAKKSKTAAKAVVKPAATSAAKTTASTANANDEEFTLQEQSVVAIPTRGLFDDGDAVTIDLSRLSRADWCYPMKNGRVISNWGGKRNHKGTDIKTHAGDTIYAAFAGRVRFSKRFSSYGNVVVLRHENGFETLYSHNQRNLVRIGDRVKAGQPIAIVGRTGRASTEHVHFEMRINGKPYNPMRFFDGTTRQLRSEKVVAYRNGRIDIINVVPEYNMAKDKPASGKNSTQKG